MWTLKKIWYRIFQFFFNLAQYLYPRHKQEVIQGAGCIKKLPALAKAKGLDTVLLVTDPILHKIGLLDSLMAACDEAGLGYFLYDGAQVNPPIECIEAAVTAYKEHGCKGFIAVGGGSAMDCAKAAAARIARPKKSISQLGGTLKVMKKIPPFFAVPTTAGTGSESTIAAIVTDAATHHKYAVQDPCLVPHYAVLDPELTESLPPHVTSTTGMDALTHAVEAYTNKFCPKSCKIWSEKAVKLIFDNLEKAYNDGHDLDARNNMLIASNLAGAAFSRACVGNVHAIAHTLGGLYNVPHGLANSVILPFVMEEYGAAVYKPLAKLADIVDIGGANDEEKAKAFIAAIHKLNQDMNITEGFDNILDKDIPQMVEWAMAEANPIYPVPVIWDSVQFTKTINRVRIKKQETVEA